MPPFYGSTDLRNSGFKLAPVDLNLFPGGFNNLNDAFMPLCVQAAQSAVERICPDASSLLLIPENHTRNQHQTVYAHLSRMDVKKGQTVEQGQTIGAVGATGWATGPHLHFEFRVNGEHQDPQTIAQQSEAAAPVSAAARPAFDRLAANMRVQLSAAALVLQASAE